MRLQRRVAVAGLDPELARSLARACQGDLRRVDVVAERAGVGTRSAGDALRRLEADGFVRCEDIGGDVRWSTTIAGNALAMASFNRPIRRVKAEALLAGVLERAAMFNADETHLLIISRLRVFGSYLDPEAGELGDLDLAVEFVDSAGDSLSVDEFARRALDYARASGRTFSTFILALDWPRREAEMILRNRSAYINITREDVDRLTDRQETVFETGAT